MPQAFPVLTPQADHLLETTVALRQTKCATPVLPARLRVGELRSQVGKLVLQLFDTSFERLRHAANIVQRSPNFHNEIRKIRRAREVTFEPPQREGFLSGVTRP
jgi:hypothetical protein